MEFRLAADPIHALQQIDENCGLDFINGDGQGEGVGFALACKRTNYGEAAGAVVTLIGKHQCRSPGRRRRIPRLKISQFFNTAGLVIHNPVARSYV